MVRAQQLREPWTADEAAVEIRPQRDHQERSPFRVARCGCQLVEERLTLVFAIAHGEQLLELVDRHHDPLTRRQPLDRLRELITVKGMSEVRSRVLSRS